MRDETIIALACEACAAIVGVGGAWATRGDGLSALLIARAAAFIAVGHC